MSARQLWLVRHAAPQIAPGICYGALDMAADAAATQACAQALAQALPSSAVVHTSTLQRCEHLAQALCAARPDLHLNFDPRLREMDFGAWEGRAWDAIERADIDQWAAHLAHHRPGGGECLAEMLSRVAAALSDAQRHSGSQDIVWITHAGVARCVAWLRTHGPQRLPQSHEWNLPAPAWGGWLTMPL